MFGPDGNLYVVTGDAQNPANSQNLGNTFGKILRMTPVGTVPAGNPFRDRAGTRPEIWATGLRNPWRYSFDRATGDLYIADVGQNALEEIDFQPAGQGGQNYGWNRMEGSRCRGGGESCDRAGLKMRRSPAARIRRPCSDRA